MNRFGTHLELLEKIIEFKKISSVIEFGMGDNSTTFFIDKVSMLTSIEMQDEKWYNKICELYKANPIWKPIKSIGPSEIFNLDYENVDLVFVDGHGETRAKCVNHMSKYSETIVAHDTEAEKVYKWSEVSLPGYFEFTDRRNQPWTTVWSKDKSLIEFLEKEIDSPEWYQCFLGSQALN